MTRDYNKYVSQLRSKFEKEMEGVPLLTDEDRRMLERKVKSEIDYAFTKNGMGIAGVIFPGNYIGNLPRIDFPSSNSI